MSSMRNRELAAFRPFLFDDLFRLFQVVRIKVVEFGLSYFSQLFCCDFTDLLFIRYAAAFGDFGRLLEQNRRGRTFDFESEALV